MNLETVIAAMWNAHYALGSIEHRTGVPAARCCQIAKDYYRREGGNTRPLEETLP
jgi:hypothetical protein